jgi:tetratricopeptide (TPR) repeat protein
LRALEIANELVQVSVGLTERCYSLANLGRAQFHLQQYEEAHESWLAAMDLAEKINHEFSDNTLLYHVTSFLLISYTIRKEYTNIVYTLNVVENAFGNDPEKMGYVHYARMKWYEHRGNLEQAKKHSYIALEYFEQTNNKSQIGKAQINVAHFEYLLRNYHKSKEMLSLAMINLKPFDYFYLLAVKDYVKVLLQLEDYLAASQVIEQNLDLAKKYPDFRGIFMVMYSIAKKDPTFAESVCEDLSMSVWVRNIACKSLMDYYSSKRDSESVMRYYEKGRILSNKKNKLFDEEGF